MDSKSLEEIQAEFGPYVRRKQIAWALGGTPTPRSLANLDSLGKGPKERKKNGREVVYPKDCAIQWICMRLGIKSPQYSDQEAKNV